ncbi:hypothetical protein Flavo103_10970 [Flavobacterium collinsii]|uniref:hypothetical protein n=1 Tax=Flavobacterium collinsii TaxID=1114861 RepID=UPI0022C2269C|nr:hypothetical protein [Flavobacterium collinsii]GIQ57961.1 hypothetical protein Flavo103_10970 [Flavobacterium collinsii]
MIDNEKIKKFQKNIEIGNFKLKFENDPKKRERLRIKIQIEELRIKIERLN